MRLYSSIYMVTLAFCPNFYGIASEVENKQLFSPNWEELVDYMISKSPSLKELNATTCTTKQDINFRATHSSIIIGKNYKWEEYRDHNNYICVNLHTPNIGFLNEKQTRSFLTAHSGYNNKHLEWSVKLLLKYYMYRDKFCDLAYEYKPSETKGFIKRVNLCGMERLVQGDFIFSLPITK